MAPIVPARPAPANPAPAARVSVSLGAGSMVTSLPGTVPFDTPRPPIQPRKNAGPDHLEPSLHLRKEARPRRWPPAAPVATTLPRTPGTSDNGAAESSGRQAKAQAEGLAQTSGHRSATLPHVSTLARSKAAEAPAVSTAAGPASASPAASEQLPRLHHQPAHRPQATAVEVEALPSLAPLPAIRPGAWWPSPRPARPAATDSAEGHVGGTDEVAALRVTPAGRASRHEASAIAGTTPGEGVLPQAHVATPAIVPATTIAAPVATLRPAGPPRQRNPQSRVDVTIGTIEIVPTAPAPPIAPPQASTPEARPSAPSGFDNFAALRAYAPWRP
jgi:hypothetical protein